MSTSAQVYIGLGSNQGDAIDNVCRAIEELGRSSSIRLQRCSSLYRSAPVGYLDQPDFVNAVCQASTSLSAEDLLEELQQLEQKAGRRRDGVRWGPRVLDLDLLLYDNAILESETLVVPHPRMHQRAFVLYPLQEISPGLQIPGRGSVDKLAALCARQDCDRLERAC